MEIDIVLPKMGATMTEGTVTDWCVAVGDAVLAGDALCEVETDKASLDIEAPADGTITQLVAVGTTVDIGGVLGRMTAADVQDQGP